MRFTKMHGLANDFVVVDGPLEPSPETVRAMCDRRRGIGADGLLAVSRSPVSGRVVMQYWNADGSTAEMCGNGLRCVAAHARATGLTDEDEFEVETPVGPKSVRVIGGGEVSVDLGPIEVGEAFDLRTRTWTPVDVGNPHVVTTVDDPEAVDVESEGPVVERDRMFPNGTNVEFVSVEGEVVTMRVWERGVGETLACGTGMVAAAAAARVTEPSVSTWVVRVRGGEARVTLSDGSAWLTGPVATVFSGDWDPQ